ncbi:MAG: hypothetical protein QW650_03615 [Thermofilum sp.]
MSSTPCPLTEIWEGKAKIRVCDLSKFADEKGYVDPAWAPVFYNPLMKCSRDISSAAVGAFAEIRGKRLKVVDAFCATGVRGIRYALENEAVELLYLNDIDPVCYELTLRNIELNSLSDIARATNLDAVRFFSEFGKFDVVDVDPFGSPVKYVDPALRAVANGGMLCVTATDLSPLVGKFPGACMRKYFSYVAPTEFGRELAVRVLLYFIAREAAKLDLRIEPLLSYYMLHHVRVCVRVLKRKVNYSWYEKNIGYAAYNPLTLERYMVSIAELQNLRSPVRASPMGPLWTSKFADEYFAEKTLLTYSKRVEEAGYCPQGKRVLSLLLSELSLPPLYFTTDAIASKYGIPLEAPLREVIEELRSRGFAASRTHFDPKGFRTTAPLEVTVKVLEEIAARNKPADQFPKTLPG